MLTIRPMPVIRYFSHSSLIAEHIFISDNEMWSSWNSKSVLTLFKEFIHTNTLWSRFVPISLLITLLKPSSTISLSCEAWEIPNSPFMISTQALIEPPLYTDDPYAKICWIWANIWCSTKQGWNFLCLASSLKKRSSPGVEWRLTFPRVLSFFWFSKMSKMLLMNSG